MLLDPTNPQPPASNVSPEDAETKGVAQANQSDGDPTLNGQIPGDAENPELNQDPAPEDDTEEVEHEGQKYKVPKALKSALMMHADYTRKTQEVAEQRRAVEVQEQQFQQRVQQQTQHLQEVAKVVALDDQIAQFEQVDWNTLNSQDPVQAQRLWMQYSQLKDTRQNMAAQLQQKEQQQAFEAQQRTAKQIEESQAVLARDIKGWSPELAGKLKDFAVGELGFNPYELAQVTDHRVIKLLHRAYVGDQLVKKQTPGGQKPSGAPVKPVPTVGANAAPAGKDMSRMSTDDWMKARNEQLRKQRSR